MEKKRCYGCMKLKTQSPVCEHCGYDERTPSAPHHIPAGTMLKEQYLVGRVLGQGGFGITYLGWDLYLDVPVAIKEYYPVGAVMRDASVSMDVTNCSGNAGARFQNNRNRFLREAKMLARFSQVPQVVQVRNFFLANNTAYIVMEYVEGITLKQYVADHGGKLGVKQTLELLRPMIRILGKVHEAGLVHRDISPDNIMLLPGGGVKLIDFGAVRDVQNADPSSPLSKSTEAILKQGFAPIEQYQQRGSLGPWTDVYALCATIYYCMTGRVPPDAPERMLSQLQMDWDKIPGLTPELAQALEEGMRLRHWERTQSTKELYAQLYPAPKAPQPEPEPAPAPKTTVAAPEKTPAKNAPRRKKAPLLAIAAAVAAVVAGIMWFVGSSPASEPDTGAQVSGVCGDNLNWSLDLDTGLLTIDGEGPMADYDQEAAPWADHRDQITALALGEAVTSVGSNAFQGCALTEVTVPDSVTSLGAGAFMDTPLTTVALGSGLESVGTKAFVNCPALTQVTFRSNPILLEHWDDRIFTGDADKNPPTGLTIHCAYGTYAWAYAAHYGVGWQEEGRWDTLAGGACGEELSWTLFEGGVFVFEGSGPMTEYNALAEADETWGYTERSYQTLPPWVDYYDQIRLVYLSPDITHMTQSAFINCKSLQYAYIPPELLKNLDSFRGAFEGTGLLQVEISGFSGEGCGMPGSFANCTELEFVSFGDSVKATITPGLFYGCTNLRKVVLGSHILPPPSGENIFKPWGGTDMTIPEDLTIYACPGGYYEEFCREYGIDFQPYILTRTCDDAFQWRSEGYQFDESGQCGDNVYWALDRGKKTLVLYAPGETYATSEATWDFTEEEHPEFYAFREEIEHVFISYFVGELGDNLFRDLTNLKTVDTGSYWEKGAAPHLFGGGSYEWIDHSFITRLGSGLFSGCTSLERFVVPDSVRTIGSAVFENCYALRLVALNWGTLPAGTFRGCASLESLILGRFGSFDEDVFGTGTAADHPKKLTLYLYTGTSAEALAKRHSIPYEIAN